VTQKIDKGSLCFADGDVISNIEIWQSIERQKLLEPQAKVTGFQRPGRYGALCKLVAMLLNISGKTG